MDSPSRGKKRGEKDQEAALISASDQGSLPRGEWIEK
jgi:hypothetical protein